MSRNILISAALASLLFSCNVPKKPSSEMTAEYPHTRYDSSDVKSYLGHEVPDPFGWLEDDRSDETAEWVTLQNAVTQDYLNQIPYRQALRDRLTALWDYEKIGAPFQEGAYTYFYYNDGLQSQYMLKRYATKKRENQNDEEEVFLDPNTFSEEGTTSLAGISFSPDGSLVAYQISEGGSDWRKVIVMNAVSKEILEDTLVDIKFSGLAWRGNEGFYYSSYDAPKAGSALSGITDHHKLFFHLLGKPQTEDALIFGGSQTPRRYVGASITEDGQYLVITAAISTTGNELYLQDLKNGGALTLVAPGFEKEYGVVTSENGMLYIQTNDGAPNNRIMVSEGIQPKEVWAERIPEGKFPMSVGSGGGRLYASTLEHAVSKIDEYDYNGSHLQTITLPGIGSVSGFYGKRSDHQLYFTFTNAITPSNLYRYTQGEKNEPGVIELRLKSAMDFDPSDYVSEQVFYASLDGTKIPMTISYKKGLQRNGKNQTILYGYGGFNISLTPSFSTSYTVWREQGGVLAIPNIRGGGEYGEAWHLAGTQLQKKNVFEDFEAAAEYLIAEGYTSSSHLALSGGSNGGLLVGAVMTRRPDLAAVAFPAVGVLDMLRYHTFTAGAGWAYDYGTAEDNEEMFQYLRSYSPVHNVKEDVCYPATMVTTADHDDRVVPAHSFKFAAALQAKQNCSAPTLIRIETNAGHGAGKPTAMVIEEAIDKMAFALWNMGYTKLPNP